MAKAETVPALFNKYSRLLLSSLCPLPEYQDGKPSQNYVNHKIVDAYESLLAGWREFVPFVKGIRNRKKVWQRKFSIGCYEYNTKTLGDASVRQEFPLDEKLSLVEFISPGYAEISTEDDGARLCMQDVYKALICGDNSSLLADVKSREEHLGKFKANLNVPGQDVTGEFYTDICEILAQALMPLHAAAADERAWASMLQLIGEHHPEVYGFLMQTYGSSAGLSRAIEKQSDLALQGYVAREEKSLEGILLPVTVAGLLAFAAGSGAILHDLHHEQSKETKNRASTYIQDASPRSDHHPELQENAWIKLNSENLDIGYDNAKSEFLVHDEKNERTLAIITSDKNTYPLAFALMYAFDFDANSWENKSNGMDLKSYIAAATYDSHRDRVFLRDDDYIWAYNYSTGELDSTAESLDDLLAGFNYDAAADSIVMLLHNYGRPETWVYNCSRDQLGSDYLRITPSCNVCNDADNKSCYDIYLGSSYDLASGKHVVFKETSGSIEVWTYVHTPEPPREWSRQPVSSVQPNFDTHRDKLSAAYDSRNDKIITQIYRGANNIFETWAYDVDENKWERQWLNGQVNIPGQLKEWAGITYDSGHNAVITLLAYDNTSAEDKISRETWGFRLGGLPKDGTKAGTFVILDDTHIGAKGADARLRQMVDNILSWREKPNYVVVLGDVSDAGAGTEGAGSYRTVLDIFKPLENAGIKIIAVDGNHDYRNTNDVLGSAPYVGGLESFFADRLQNYKNILGNRDISGKFIDRGSYVLIGLDSGHDLISDILEIDWDPECSGLADSQVQWLEDVLDNLDGLKDGRDSSGKAKIIFIHAPIVYELLNSGTIAHNRDKILELAEKYEIDVIFAGHKHRNSYKNIDYTRHITTSSVAYEGTWRNASVVWSAGTWRMVVGQPQTLGKIMYARTGSPVDLEVYDSSGKILPQVSSSFAIDNNGSKQIEVSVDYKPGLKFRVVGAPEAKNNDTYDLEILLNSEDNRSRVAASGKNLPIGKGVVCEYAPRIVDWEGTGVTLRLDFEGDGWFDTYWSGYAEGIPADDINALFQAPKSITNKTGSTTNNAINYVVAAAVILGAGGAGGYLAYQKCRRKKRRKLRRNAD